MIKSKRAQTGINIVELLIVVAILAMSLTVGVPSFQDLKLSSDRSAALIELVTAIRMARSEAALRGTPASVCASADGVSCSGGADWSGGWLVFQDPDQDIVIEDQTQVLKAVQFENVRFSITADDSIRGGITFGIFGFSMPTAGQFTYRDAFEARDIALTYVGRLHVTEPSS
jgi:type IV fimbrial biogenesis protein FimT